MRRAIVIFTRGVSREPKRFGLGRFADARLTASLVERTLATAERCASLGDVIVADDGWQSGATFEDRLLSALRLVRARGQYDRVVIIGTDTPGLSERDLRIALSTEKAVVGPSADGGFYLLGLGVHLLEDALRGLPWCTGGVAAALEARLGPVMRLSVRCDLDDARDARRMLAVLRSLFGALDNVAVEPEPGAGERSLWEGQVIETGRPRGPPLAG